MSYDIDNTLSAEKREKTKQQASKPMMDKKKTSKKKTSKKVGVVPSTRRGHGDKVSYMSNMSTNMTTSVYKTPKAGPSYRDVLNLYTNTHTYQTEQEALRAHVLERVRQFDNNSKITKRAEWRQQLEQAGLIRQNDNRDLSAIILGLKEEHNLASPTPAQQAPDYPAYPVLQPYEASGALRPEDLLKIAKERAVDACRSILVQQYPFTLDKDDVQHAVNLLRKRFDPRPNNINIPNCLGSLLDNPLAPVDIKSALYIILLQYLVYGCHKHLQAIAHVLHSWFGYSELLGDYTRISGHVNVDRDAGCNQSKVGGGKPLPTRQRRAPRRSQAK